MTEIERKLLMLLADYMKQQLESGLHGDNADVYFLERLRPLEKLISELKSSSPEGLEAGGKPIA